MVRDIATCLYYTGIDPFTKKEVHVAKGIKDRKMHRALMQFLLDPEHERLNNGESQGKLEPEGCALARGGVNFDRPLHPHQHVAHNV